MDTTGGGQGGRSGALGGLRVLGYVGEGRCLRWRLRVGGAVRALGQDGFDSDMQGRYVGYAGQAEVKQEQAEVGSPRVQEFGRRRERWRER